MDGLAFGLRKSCAHLGKCGGEIDLAYTHRRTTFVVSLDSCRDEWVGGAWQRDDGRGVDGLAFGLRKSCAHSGKCGSACTTAEVVLAGRKT